MLGTNWSHPNTKQARLIQQYFAHATLLKHENTPGKVEVSDLRKQPFSRVRQRLLERIFCYLEHLVHIPFRHLAKIMLNKLVIS